MNILAQKLERASYLVLILGSFLDHGSTMLCLAFRNDLAELNPLVSWMTSSGTWHLFDLSALILIIASIHVALRNWKHEKKWMLLTYPLILGIARMLAGLWNLSLMR